MKSTGYPTGDVQGSSTPRLSEETKDAVRRAVGVLEEQAQKEKSEAVKTWARNLCRELLARITTGVVLLVLLVGCESRSDELRTLDSSGFSNASLGDFAFFKCGRDDDQGGREFTATNSAGKRVSGFVCCGMTKGCTVRF